MSIADAASAGLKRRPVGQQRVIVAIGITVVAVATAGTLYAVTRPEPLPPAAVPRAFPSTINLPVSTTPGDLVVTDRGAWIADSAQPTVSFADRDGSPVRQIQIPGDYSDKWGVSAMAADSMGNIWLNVNTSENLVGLAPDGRVIHSYELPAAADDLTTILSIVIDGSDTAWVAASDWGDTGGVLVYAVDLKGDAVQSARVMPNAPPRGVDAASLVLDTHGKPWLSAQIATYPPRRHGELVQYNLAGSLSRNSDPGKPPLSFTDREFHWPQKSLPAAGFAVDSQGQLWLGSYGNIAKIASDGTVTRLPLLENLEVSQIQMSSDGKVVFSGYLGPGVLHPRWSVIGSFDPRDPADFPDVRRLPTELGPFTNLGDDQVILSQPEEHAVVVADIAPSRATVSSSETSASMRSIGKSYLHDLKLARHNASSNQDVVAWQHQAALDLSDAFAQVLSDDDQAPDPAVAARVAGASADFRRIERSYGSSGLLGPDLEQVPGWATIATVLRGMTTLSVLELLRMFDGAIYTPVGTTDWAQCDDTEVCIGNWALGRVCLEVGRGC